MWEWSRAGPPHSLRTRCEPEKEVSHSEQFPDKCPQVSLSNIGMSATLYLILAMGIEHTLICCSKFCWICIRSRSRWSKACARPTVECSVYLHTPHKEHKRRRNRHAEKSPIPPHTTSTHNVQWAEKLTHYPRWDSSRALFQTPQLSSMPDGPSWSQWRIPWSIAAALPDYQSLRAETVGQKWSTKRTKT